MPSLFVVPGTRHPDRAQRVEGRRVGAMSDEL